MSNNLRFLSDAYICNNLHDLVLINDIANHRQLQIPNVIVFSFDIPRYDEAKCLTALMDVPDVVANGRMKMIIICKIWAKMIMI